MKNNFSAFCFLLVFSLGSLAVSLANQPMALAEEAAGIKIMEKELVGRFLTDGKGMTLYRFTRDETNTSHCIEGCAVNWPPFYVDPAAVVEGCESSDFTTITRSDGIQQTAYKGMPLYYFKNDKYPGDTFGQGLGDAWFLVSP